MPQDLSYVLLLFVLFVVPRFLQRYRLPGAVTALALGVAATALGLFQHDETIALMSTFGIVALFLFAGLDVDLEALKPDARVLAQHLAIWTVTLALLTWAATWIFALAFREGALVALALITPSTGFILDSLGLFGLSDSERRWTKAKAIASEILALTVMFLALQSKSAEQLGLSVLAMTALIVMLPPIFRWFAGRIAPFAPALGVRLPADGRGRRRLGHPAPGRLLPRRRVHRRPRRPSVPGAAARHVVGAHAGCGGVLCVVLRAVLLLSRRGVHQPGRAELGSAGNRGGVPGGLRLAPARRGHPAPVGRAAGGAEEEPPHRRGTPPDPGVHAGDRGYPAGPSRRDPDPPGGAGPLHHAHHTAAGPHPPDARRSTTRPSTSTRSPPPWTPGSADRRRSGGVRPRPTLHSPHRPPRPSRSGHDPAPAPSDQPAPLPPGSPAPRTSGAPCPPASAASSRRVSARPRPSAAAIQRGRKPSSDATDEMAQSRYR